jgi:hypothetical protein
LHFIALGAILFSLLNRRFIYRFYPMNCNYFAGIKLIGVSSLPQSCSFCRDEALSNILLGILLFFLGKKDKMPNYTLV